VPANTDNAFEGLPRHADIDRMMAAVGRHGGAGRMLQSAENLMRRSEATRSPMPTTNDTIVRRHRDRCGRDGRPATLTVETEGEGLVESTREAARFLADAGAREGDDSSVHRTSRRRSPHERKRRHRRRTDGHGAEKHRYLDARGVIDVEGPETCRPM